MLPPLRPYQETVVQSRARDDVTVSAPQIGKTTAVQCWLLAESHYVGRTDHPWWWVAPTYQSARHGFLGMCELAVRAGLMRPNDFTTTVPLQAVSIFGIRYEGRSWEKVENVRGPTVLGAAVDEFGLLNDRAYRVLSGRRAESVTWGLGFYRWIGNVGEVGGPAEDLWNSAESGEPGFACRRWTWRDRAAALPCACGIEAVEYRSAHDHAAVCPRGVYLVFLHNEARRMSAAEFRQEYEAEWIDWNLRPAYEFERGVHVNATHSEYQRELPLHLTCDFNVDPMGWVLGQVKGDLAWDFDEVRMEGGANTKQMCRKVLEKCDEHDVDRLAGLTIFGDRSGNSRDTRSNTTDYQIMREMLSPRFRDVEFDVPHANPGIRARLNAVNAKLNPVIGEPSYFIHPRCTSLANDRARVSRKEDGTIDKTGERNKKLSHFSDASDYRIVRLFPVRQDGEAHVETPPDDGGAAAITEMRF